MANNDFWKQRYQGEFWEKASERERTIKDLIYRATGKQVEFTGLGAGTTEFLSGSAASQGFERGGADLFIVGTNIYLEVTGPQSPKVFVTSPLWIRPDKIASARSHYPQNQTFVIHWLEKDGTLRVIPLNAIFFRFMDQGAFPIVHPQIRGTQETYVEVPAAHQCVRSWSGFIEWLKKM